MLNGEITTKSVYVSVNKNTNFRNIQNISNYTSVYVIEAKKPTHATVPLSLIDLYSVFYAI